MISDVQSLDYFHIHQTSVIRNAQLSSIVVYPRSYPSAPFPMENISFISCSIFFKNLQNISSLPHGGLAPLWGMLDLFAFSEEIY